MFGKKLLSVVGLLFLGSQIISVEAGCVPSLAGGKCSTDGYDANNAGKLYLANDGQGGEDYIVVIGEGGKSCTKEEGECGVNVAGDKCTVTSCGLEDKKKLFIDGGKIVEVTVTEDVESGEITRSCAPKELNGNFCTTEDDNVVNTIEGFCEGVCAEGKPTYSCLEGACIADVNPRSCKRATCSYNGTTFSECKKVDYLIVTENVGLVEVQNQEGVLYKCSDVSTCAKVGNNEGEKN